PASNLSLVRQGDHFAGNSFFQNAWVTAPASTAARDGLGPLFNTMSCQSCHIKDGRGKTPDAGKPMLSVLVRMSVPAAADGSDEEHVRRHGVVPHPVYGDQIQPRAVAGVAPEAIPTIEWTEEKGAYPDGTRYTLRRPRVVLGDLAYGELGDDAQISTRVAPALVGIGLLDTIAEEDLLRLADPDDEDGISGRPNTVWDIAADAPAIGRFGWKGEQPSVRQQVAAAFAGDIGITSSLFQADSLSPAQREAIDAPNGGTPEVSDKILYLVTFYSKTLAVPARRGHDDAFVREGQQLFHEVGCASCHVPRFVTGDDPEFPELSGQTIYPYTDLLLHDMGEGLADDRPVFDATGSEWRTPPLWGIGLVFNVNRHTELLHDGRARNAEEAILWHGGEAEASRDAFKELSKEERRKLLAFLKSL
ncbi:MAG: di-heme oxidoredictase family protein, partial [Planctomycetota bacterium]